MFGTDRLLKPGAIFLVLVLSLSLTGPLDAQSPVQPAQASAVPSPWEPIETYSAASLYALDMNSDASDGWAGGASGSLLHYTAAPPPDPPWQPDLIQIEAAIQGLDMVSANAVWAVTSHGHIFRYNGTDWIQAYKSTQAWLNGIYMASATRGWAVGNHGTILSYAGGSWAEASVGEFWLESIDMLPNLSLGWMVGGGVIFRWDGTRWSQSQTVPGVWLRDVDMVSATDAWAVGGVAGSPTTAQVIYRFNGTTWSEVGRFGEGFLRSVHMLSASEGWAVGENGTILHYNGQNWESIPSPTTADLYGVYMVLGPQGFATNGWAVGRQGTVLHYVGRADLSSSWKRVDAVRAMPGDTLTYTVRLKNSGTIPSAQVVVSDAIPAGTTYQAGSASATRGTITGPNPLVLTIANGVQPAEEIDLTFRVTVQANPGVDCWFVSNQAQIAVGADPPMTRAALSVIGTPESQLYLPIIYRKSP